MTFATQNDPREGGGGCPPGAHTKEHHVHEILSPHSRQRRALRLARPPQQNVLLLPRRARAPPSPQQHSTRPDHHHPPPHDPAGRLSARPHPRRAPPPLDFPPLEDRHAIQVALSLVITALAENRIDPKLAALLFYGLQVASSNAHKLNPIPKRDPCKVSLTILDEANGNLIAPEERPRRPRRDPGL